MMRPGPGTWSPLVPPRVSATLSATLSAMLTGDTDKDTGYEALGLSHQMGCYDQDK